MKQIELFYADDDDDDLMFFNEAIEKISKDHDIKILLHLHKNGENLVENIKTKKDTNGVVFLDINMPLKSGFELLDEIRNEPEIKEFPVIMYSTSSNQDNIDKSRSLGANFYVIKPYQYSNLLKMITTFIQMNWEDHQSDSAPFLYK
ncbi:response regulator [Flavobacterium sp.]|uniref:response regulator n=1 Tax=Flavobacterium sp. TaxID=239 RepID=UPI002487566D|nr:response regulator [Flavobacterium sp.]MDI1316645.1 response regulator [Flavobacterium sp.]